MIQAILQRQKTQLALILLTENKLIKRDVLERAQKQLQHNLVKVITGPRRAGKSTLALQLLEGKKFGFVNFDDPDFNFEKINFSELTESIDRIYGNTEYLLFDEIQNLPKWEIYLNSLQRAGYNLIVTGSNAKMLSRDLATVLTGRAVEIQVLPFSFQEARKANNSLSAENFLLNGNYPEVFVKKIEPEIYYQALFNTSIVKDVVVRYSIRNPLDLENTARYLLSTLTNTYSYRSVADKLGLSAPTVIDYIGYLVESFLFFQLPAFSNKQSEIIRSNKKVYCVDYAFAKFNTLSLSNNHGYALENAVFVELLRKGYVPGKTLFYYKTRGGYEIDFVSMEKNKKLNFYQVCYSLEDDKTLEREVSSFAKAKSELGDIGEMFLISMGKERVSGEIKTITFEDFVKL